MIVEATGLADGRTVATIATYIDISCATTADSAEASGEFSFQHLGTRGASFRGSQSFTDTSVPGLTIHYRLAIRGTFGARHASGTWSAQATIIRSSGATDRCRSSNVTWLAGSA